MTDIDWDQAERVIQRIAELAQAMGEDAGVGVIINQQGFVR